MTNIDNLILLLADYSASKNIKSMCINFTCLISSNLSQVKQHKDVIYTRIKAAVAYRCLNVVLKQNKIRVTSKTERNIVIYYKRLTTQQHKP